MTIETTATIIQFALGIVFFGVTILVVFLTVKKWDPAIRHYVGQRFRVEIEISGKGQWQVLGDIAWYKKLAIESFQLVIYLTLFAFWSVAAIVLVLAMELTQTLIHS